MGGDGISRVAVLCYEKGSFVGSDWLDAEPEGTGRMSVDPPYKYQTSGSLSLSLRFDRDLQHRLGFVPHQTDQVRTDTQILFRYTLPFISVLYLSLSLLSVFREPRDRVEAQSQGAARWRIGADRSNGTHSAVPCQPFRTLTTIQFVRFIIAWA